MFLIFDLVRVILVTVVPGMLLGSLSTNFACSMCATVTTLSERISKIFRKDILKEFIIEQKGTEITNHDIT